MNEWRSYKIYIFFIQFVCAIDHTNFRFGLGKIAQMMGYFNLYIYLL